MTQVNKDNFDYILGMNLKYLRMERKISQERMGKILNVTFQQVQKYERGKNAVSSYRLKMYLDYFQVGFREITDMHFIQKKEALKETKDYNNGGVKYKDFMNAYSDMINE